MAPVPESGGLRLCLVTRWWLAAACSLGHPPSCLEFQTARTGQTPQNITAAEPILLPDAIWTPVPLTFILVNPVGTSPAKDLISQIPIGSVLGTVSHLIYGNLSCRQTGQ